jgi:hypothetical protein
MKTVSSLVCVAVVAACAGCATAPPRTLSALPDPPTERQMLQPLKKTASGDFPGYQRIVVDNETLYCRQNSKTNAQTGSRVVCLTEAQLRNEHLLALRAAAQREIEIVDNERAPTPNVDNVYNANQAQGFIADQPHYGR